MISFIIPAHNAQDYLERAVSSILDGATEGDVQVLIVENGSTDETALIGKKLMDQFYPQVVLYESEKGVSKARNMGIEKAEGEWIVFVDADDYLVPGATKVLKEDAKKGLADLYLYGHESGEQQKMVEDSEGSQFYGREGDSGNTLEAARVMMIENPTRYMQAWAKMIRKSTLLKSGINFREELRLSEDSDFILRLSRWCESLCIRNEVIYHYSIDNVSTMRTYEPQKVYEYEKAMKITGESMQQETDRVRTAFSKYVLMHLNIALVRAVFCVENHSSFAKKVKQMKNVQKAEIYQQAINKIKIRECISPRMIPVLCMKWHVYPLAGIVYQIRAKQNAAREKQ